MGHQTIPLNPELLVHLDLFNKEPPEQQPNKSINKNVLLKREQLYMNQYHTGHPTMSTATKDTPVWHRQSHPDRTATLQIVDDSLLRGDSAALSCPLSELCVTTLHHTHVGTRTRTYVSSYC